MEPERVHFPPRPTLTRIGRKPGLRGRVDLARRSPG
jgi:hypothetical protein